MDMLSSYDDLCSGHLDGLPVTPSRPPLPLSSLGREGSQQNSRGKSRKPRRERKAACTECRQQKLKCDSHLYPNNPCSRCSRLGLSCFQSLEFQRVAVRRTRESKVISHGSNEEVDLTIPLLIPTRPRFLSDIHVSDRTIDECFEIFFSHYSPLLPIFTERLIPNDCYQKSLTLFWAIIATGSRSLTKDPTLLQGLAPEVLNLALISFQSRRNQLDDIKGILILCTWPCPTTTMLKDNTVALSGLLLSLSMQAGLHVPTGAFAHLTGPGIEQQSYQQNELASLWAHVVIVCQSTMTFGGYPSIVSFTNMASRSFEKTSWQFVSNHLKLRYRIHALLSEFESVIIDLGLDNGPADEQLVLSSRIKASEDQLENLRVEFCCTPFDEIYVQIARLLLEVLQLHCNAETTNQTELMQLFSTASALIMSVKTLEDTTSITSYAPSYFPTSIYLAAFTLLRMMKSRLDQILDPNIRENGKAAFFVAVNLLKRMSLVNNDICAKSAEFLSIMWTNHTIFQTSEPYGSWKLRIRNRLSMSVVFDSILVWVESYGCIKVVPASLLQPSDVPESSEVSNGTPESMNEGPKGDYPSFSVDDRWLYELDWNASLDGIMVEQARGDIPNLNRPH